MNAIQGLQNLGQSIWLDNITRDLLNSGTLKHYADELSVTGLTSNPTIFDHAIKNSTAYDGAIREKVSKGKSGEALFFELALEDLARVAALFRPIHARTDSADGWMSLEVSPALAYDTSSTLAAADAYLRGVERRIDAGLKPGIGSVASVFISRWDSAVMTNVPDPLRDRLDIAIAKRTYKAYRAFLDSPRWQRALNAGGGVNGCYGPAPEPRILKRPMSCTSRLWLRHLR
jgi:transaldolase